MRKKKHLTKKERKALDARNRPAGGDRHIHCIACGRHLHPGEFTSSPVTARYLSCLHRKKFPVCASCVRQGERLLKEHDRSGAPVKIAAAWH